MHEARHEYKLKESYINFSMSQGFHLRAKQSVVGKFSFQNWMICDSHKSFKCGWFVNIMVYLPNLDDVMPVFYNIELKNGTWMICTTQI